MTKNSTYPAKVSGEQLDADALVRQGFTLMEAYHLIAGQIAGKAPRQFNPTAAHSEHGGLPAHAGTKPTEPEPLS